MEKTFMMIKPSGVQRNLIGEVIKRIENKGFKIVAMKLINVSKEQAMKHYDVHKDKPFFKNLVTSIQEGPVVVMAIAGHNCVEIVRMMAGATKPTQSLPGTIRGDFSSDIRLNIVHTADSVARAKYEMEIYFDKKEILKYEKIVDKFVYSED